MAKGMIISVPHRFVFVSIPKCASTSIEAALRRQSSIALVNPPSLKHCTLADYETYIEPMLASKRIDVSSFAIYALFRNPVDWVESWWRFRTRDKLTKPSHINHQNYTGDVSLEQFAKACASDHPPSYARIRTQVEFIEDRTGSTGRVHLFRYDDMDGFVNHLSERVGADIAVKRKNQSPPRSDRLSEEAINGLRARTPRDFLIYDSISSNSDKTSTTRPEV